MLSRQIESVASLDSRGCAVALSIFAAVLFGALAGLDRRLAGHKAASAFTIAVGLSGWVIGLLWTAYAPPDWSFDSIWVELSAACCVFALGFGGEDGADSDPDETRDALFLRLFQSAAFGIASAVGAFGYSLAFLSFMVAGHLLEWALTRLLRLDSRSGNGRAHSAHEHSAQQHSVYVHSARDIGAARNWLDDAPPTFIAALNAAFADEAAPRTGSSSPEHRQIKVVHNSAKPSDARYAANTQSIARGHGTVAQRKIPTEARDPAPGRR